MRRPQAFRLRTGRVSERGRVYFITTCCASRTPIFASPTLARLLCRQLYQEDRSPLLGILAYVVMPDHLHVLLELIGREDLSTVVGQLKGRAAAAINSARHCHGAVWQKGFHDHALRTDESVARSASYLIQNPVRAGLVTAADDYAYWDTIWHDRSVIAGEGLRSAR